jgi:hypothetical protein
MQEVNMAAAAVSAAEQAALALEQPTPSVIDNQPTSV